jgi:hypothetical protein
MKVYTGMKQTESLIVEVDFYMRFWFMHRHNSNVFFLSENLPTVERITPKDYSSFIIQ